MNQATKDLLTILVPAIATVLAATLPVFLQILAARRQAATRSSQSPEQPPPGVAPAPPSSPPRFPHRRVYSGALIGAIVGVVAVVAIRFVIPTTETPELTVEALHLPFSGPDTFPDPSMPISVPPIAHTVGTTQFVVKNNRFAWLEVCREDQNICTINQLFLDVAGGWDQFINIGTKPPSDNCAVFEVGFVIVDGGTNSKFLGIDQKSTITQNDLPTTLLRAKRFLTRRMLNDTGSRIFCEDLT